MKVNQLKVGVILNYVQLILGCIISIIITPIMINKLGMSEYGIINLSSSTLSYLGLITLGIGSAFIRYNVRYRTNNDKLGEAQLNGLFIMLYLIMSVVMMIAGIGLIFSADYMFANSLTPNEIYRTKIVMGISLANIVIALPFSIFTMNINAYEHYLFGKAVTVINTVLNPLIRLPILFLGGLSISLTIATTILHLITCVIEACYALLYMKIKIKFSKPDKTLLKSLFAFSFFIVINQIIDMINWNVDKFILGIVGGTVMVAVYSLGAAFNSYAMNFSFAISSVLTPKINKLVANNTSKEELNELFVKTGRIQFVLIAFIITALIFFGKSFIVNFYANESYLDAYYIALLLIVPLIIPLIQNIGIEIQRAMNKHKFRSIVYLGIAIFNVAASVPLAMFYGGIGAAMGTCVSLLLGQGLIMNIYYHKSMELNMWHFWWNILKFLPSLIVPIIAGSLMMVYVDTSNIWIFLGSAVGYTVIYGISVYFLGMNKYEKDLFTKPFKKLWAKTRKSKVDSDEVVEAVEEKDLEQIDG